MERRPSKTRMSLNHLSMLEKIQRRRELQVIRSRRYRERQRHKREMMDGEFPPTYRDNYVSGKPLTGRYPRVRGWRGAFRGRPLSKNVSRSSRDQTNSFWAPSLDDRTKYMMRSNGLVVGFVWQKDEAGGTLLSGTRVVRFDPLSNGPPRGGYPKELLKNFSVKVPPDYRAPIPKICAMYDEFAQDHINECMTAEEGLPQQREEDTFLERPKQREKVRETAKTREIRKRLHREKPLDSYRYALYRYFMLRCRSIHQVRRHKPEGKHPEPTNSQTSEQTSQNELCLGEAHRRERRRTGDLTLNSRLARLRTRLAVCTGDGSRAGQRLMDLMSEEYSLEDADDQDEYLERDVVAITTGAKSLSKYNFKQKSDSTTGDSDASSSDADQKVRRKSVQRKPKTLKVKRQREKQREEQEEWGVEAEEEEESHRQKRSQIRARRYQFLKSAKQSRLHQDQADHHPSTTLETDPNIIHVESLSGDNIQALSWDVPADTDPDTDPDTAQFFMQHLQ